MDRLLVGDVGFGKTEVAARAAFKAVEFGTLVPWLALNRNGLTVFVHGLSGQDMYDHTELVMWLGDSVALDLSAL
jgi:aromatic ring-cleaving dioxygenase